MEILDLEGSRYQSLGDLGLTGLHRSFSQDANMENVQQLNHQEQQHNIPHPHQLHQAPLHSSPGHPNGPTFNFSASDLDDSTFVYAPQIENPHHLHNHVPAPTIALTSLDRGLSTNSMLGLSFTENEPNWNDIPAPFPPLRGLTEITLGTFETNTDNTGNFIASNTFEPAALASPTNIQNVQFEQPLAVPANVEFDNATVGSRKRHRGETIATAVTAASNPLLYSSASRQISNASLPPSHPMLSPTSSTSSASSSKGAAAALPVTAPVLKVSTSSSSRSRAKAVTTASPSPVDEEASQDGSVSPQGENETHKEFQKKVKHQMTDRQRRAKIKESMDQLKALVPLDSGQKADQATIVAESVDMIKSMKDELTSLRAKVAMLELSGQDGKDGEKKIQANRLQQAYSQSSPYSAMMSSLNGAGVSMWRLGLDGRMLEVNLVFEMVTGFSAADLLGKSPCGAPLYGSLSVMPKSFLRYFSNVTSLVSGVTGTSEKDKAAPMSPLSPSSDEESSSSQSSQSSNPSSPSPSNPPRVTSAAPSLFSNVTINSLPIVPQNELTSFFPFKCRSLLDTNSHAAQLPGPQPHGAYLINHLSLLPANHVLKLLSRVSTSYGDTLESIVTMCLVRTPVGSPDYILCLATPDGRRLVKPTKFLNPPINGFPPMEPNI